MTNAFTAWLWRLIEQYDVACTSVASVPNDISPERQLSEDIINKHQFYIRPAVAEYNRRRPRGLAPTATHVEAQLGSK